MTRKRKRSEKRERRKKFKQERKRQLRIIENRAKDINYKLKKDDNGEKYFLTFQGIEIGQILGVSPPISLPQKFRKHRLNRQWFFVSVQKETPRRNFTLYPDFANLFCHTVETLKTLK